VWQPPLAPDVTRHSSRHREQPYQRNQKPKQQPTHRNQDSQTEEYQTAFPQISIIPSKDVSIQAHSLAHFA
jgi:hypothetical protein